MSAPASVEFAGVGFKRGQRDILRDVSFSVAAGEFIGILGSNGAGKSTLLGLALGFLEPSEGRVSIMGNAPGRARGTMAYLPQRIELDPDLPLRARDYVALGVDGAHFGMPLPSAARRDRVMRALTAVGAGHHANSRVGRLSGGEQQRLTIAQAIVSEPRLLLLDEPLANVDLRGAAEIVELVARLRRELGITVLFVAHDINPLMGVIDRVLYLAEGRALIGSVDDVVNEATLSALYGRHVDVLRVHGRVIVLAGDALHTFA